MYEADTPLSVQYALGIRDFNLWNFCAFPVSGLNDMTRAGEINFSEVTFPDAYRGTQFLLKSPCMAESITQTADYSRQVLQPILS